MTNVKPPLIGKNRLPPFITFTQCWHLQSFSEKKTLTLQQNQSHQFDGGAHGGHFRPKISHKKFITYPLNTKISLAELCTSSQFVPAGRIKTRVEFPMITAMHGKSGVLSAIPVCDN